MLEEKLSTNKISLIDAAVSGGPDGAAAGTLSVMVGGSEDSYNTILPVLEQIGKPVHCGPSGSGHAVKCVNNILNMTHLLAAAEDR
eukprot:UN06641